MFMPKELGDGKYEFQCMQCNEPMVLDEEDKVHISLNEEGDMEGAICNQCYDE